MINYKSKIIDLTGQDLTNFEPEAGMAYLNLPNELYHGLKDWESSSTIKHLSRSIESWKYEKTVPPKQTVALENGSALHLGQELLIEGNSIEYWDSEVKTFDGKKIPNKKYDVVKSEFPNNPVIPEFFKPDMKNMVLNGYHKMKDNNLLSPAHGFSELSGFWIDPATGVKCKFRPDYTNFNLMFLLDYKTTKDISLTGWPKEIANWGYDISAAFYKEGFYQVFGEVVKEFIHIVFANTPPFETRIKPLGYQSIQAGREFFKKCFDMIATGKDHNQDFQITEMPKWAINKRLGE